MSSLYTGRMPTDVPGPTPGAEAVMRERVKSMDELLDIRWFATAYWNGLKGRWEGRYALVSKWPKSDPRWQMVFSGEIAPDDAEDLIGWMTEDMGDANSVPVSLEAMENRVCTLLHSCDEAQFPWKKRMAQIIEKNAAVRRKKKTDAGDHAFDVALDYYQHKLPKSYVSKQIEDNT